MIEGACLCGAVHWQLDTFPEGATACNCTACRRYGALWAYGHEGEDVAVTGPTETYVRGKALAFHFCPKCGCIAYWRALAPWEGRTRVGVNLRLTDPAAILELPIDHFDGLATYRDLPRDGRCVSDMWF